MAVSTKTLTPTGQVVSIPDMTEKPNASVLSDGISKEADAINALDTKLTNNNLTDIVQKSGSSNYTILNTSSNPSKYIKRGGFCWVNIGIRCNTPGEEEICDSLPHSLTYTVNIPVPEEYTTGDTSLRLLYQNNKLYAIGGTANKTYSINFCYPCE